MNREEKAAVIDQIADELGASDAIFALDYRGITVAQIAELRDKLRPSDTKLRVAKNSLSERAADQAGVADIKPLLVGPTALALVKGDAAAAAKVLSDTVRALRGPLEFKGGFMGGSVLTPDSGRVDRQAPLARCPQRPAGRHHRRAAHRPGPDPQRADPGLAIQLGQIRDQGLVSGTASRRPRCRLPQPPTPSRPQRSPHRLRRPRRLRRLSAESTEAAGETEAAADAETARLRLLRPLRLRHARRS